MSLPRRVRAGYGVAELGINGVEVLIRVGLLIFYTDVVGLDASLAGYAVALGVLWDAFTDPLMGRISDRTCGRHGRRRPYIALGAVLLAVGIVALFSPPAVDTQAGKFLVLLGSYVFANTAMTIVAVPHSALAGDLSRDGDERTELFGWRLLFANLGLVLGTLLPGALIAATPHAGDVAARAHADRTTAVVLGVVTVAAALVTLSVTRGRDVAAPSRGDARAPLSYLGALASLLRNRAFTPLLAACLVANVGLNLNATVALYYYRYRLVLEETQTRALIAAFMFVFCISIPLWIALARRHGKKRPVVGATVTLGVMTCIAYPLFPVGSAAWPLIAAVLGGAAIGAVVLLDAMLADVVDHDRVHSGEARFGLYFGFWKMSAKASRALAIALAGNALAWIGFTPNVAQSAEASRGLALLFGPGVGIFFLLAAVLLALHPIDEARGARVRRILDRRDRRARERERARQVDEPARRRETARARRG